MGKQELKKHVGAIHISGKLSLLERKVANVLLFNAYNKLLEEDSHTIRLRDLANVAGFNSKDDAMLKGAFRQLAKTTIEWNILDNKGEEEWTVASLLSRATIKKGHGVCNYAYDRELCKKLYHPGMYASINLEIQRKFKSAYALVLYENCVRYRKIKTTGWIMLEDWRLLFGIKNSQYLLYKDFAKRVLNPAIKEVNQHSDIRVEPEFRRESRKINRIKFRITPAPKEISQNMEEGDSLNTLNELVSLGVGLNAANKLITDYEESQIRVNIKYVTDTLNQGSAITNIGGYLIKAIEQNYASTKVDSLNRNREKLRQQHEKEALDEKLSVLQEKKRDIENAYREACIYRIEQQYGSLSDAEKRECTLEFSSKLTMPPERKSFVKSGWKSRMLHLLIIEFWEGRAEIQQTEIAEISATQGVNWIKLEKEIGLTKSLLNS